MEFGGLDMKVIVQCDKLKCRQNKSGFCRMDVVYLDGEGQCFKKGE